VSIYLVELSRRSPAELLAQRMRLAGMAKSIRAGTVSHESEERSGLLPTPRMTAGIVMPATTTSGQNQLNRFYRAMPDAG
jgi:hypothetical protein